MKIILDAFGYRIADDIKRWGRRCSGNRPRSRGPLRLGESLCESGDVFPVLNGGVDQLTSISR